MTALGSEQLAKVLQDAMNARQCAGKQSLGWDLRKMAEYILAHEGEWQTREPRGDRPSSSVGLKPIAPSPASPERPTLAVDPDNPTLVYCGVDADGYRYVADFDTTRFGGTGEGDAERAAAYVRSMRPTGAATPGEAAIEAGVAASQRALAEWTRRARSGEHVTGEQIVRAQVAAVLATMDRPSTPAREPSEAAIDAVALHDAQDRGITLKQWKAQLGWRWERTRELIRRDLAAAYAVDHPPTGDLREQAAQVADRYAAAANPASLQATTAGCIAADIRALQPQPTGDEDLRTAAQEMLVSLAAHGLRGCSRCREAGEALRAALARVPQEQEPKP